jgi:hypothetical protein
MNDLVNDIVGYLDKQQLNIDSFIDKYSEKDIVNNFISKFDKLNFKYSHFLNIIDIDSFDVDGVFSNYTKNIFKYSLYLLYNYDNNYGISIVEKKIRRLCNIYINDTNNIINCFNSIKSIINNVIDTNPSFYKYGKFKMTIMHTVINSINKNLCTSQVMEYKINTIDVY